MSKQYNLEKQESSRLIGPLVIEWDNMEDNTVRAFNELFDDTLHYPEDEIVEILEPYTHNGRLIKVGDRKPEQHLFFRESWYGNDRTYLEVVTPKGEVIGLYKKTMTIAQDFGITQNYVNAMLKSGRIHMEQQFYVRKRNKKDKR